MVSSAPTPARSDDRGGRFHFPENHNPQPTHSTPNENIIMNPNTTSTTLLDAVCRRGVLVSTSVRYWRGCKKLNPEDLGLDPANVSDRLIQLGHKRLIPRDALQPFALIESRVQATVEMQFSPRSSTTSAR